MRGVRKARERSGDFEDEDRGVSDEEVRTSFEDDPLDDTQEGGRQTLPPTRRYTTRETCEILGIHRNTLRRRTEDGSIRCVYMKAGSRMYPLYLGRDIMKFWRQLV